MDKLKSPEIIFVIFAFVFGIIIMFVTPKYQVPDEYAHLCRAQEVSNGILYNNLPQNRQDGYKFHGASGYSPVMYVFSGLGYKIGNFSNNDDIAFYFGRFFNLIIWITLIFFAIKVTPIFKWQFLFTSLFPTSLFLGASYSADSFNNAFAFLLFGYMFKIIFEKQDISLKKDVALISLCGITGAMCKCAIAPLFLLLFEKINKFKKLIVLLIITFVIGLAYLWSINNYTFTGPGVNQSYNKQILQYNPLEFIKIFTESCIYYFIPWIKQLIARLGLLTIGFNHLFYKSTILFFILLLLYIPEKYTIKISQRIYSFLILLGYVFFTCALLFINWTPIDSPYIAGIQGRYFIAILPLIFIILKPNIKHYDIKISRIMKKALIIYIFLMLFYCTDTLKGVYSSIYLSYL